MIRRSGRPEAGGEPVAPEPDGRQRIDKWLWYVRLVKSRTLASTLVTAGKVRVNRLRVEKASATIAPGDVVTIAAGRRVRVLRVLSTGTRRGPATEAQTLYDDLTPEPDRPVARRADGAGAAADPVADPPTRDAGAGRPTKRERRELDRLRGRNGAD